MPAAVTNIAASRSLKIRKVNISGLVTLGSSSSFTSELFGSNQFQKSSASGIFESMFPPPPKVLGRGSLCSEVSGKSSSEGWNSKFVLLRFYKFLAMIKKFSFLLIQITSAWEIMEQRLQPCQLSSSIHYGGQDIYSCPKSTQDSGYNSLLYKKDGVEDDLGSNLWQGKTYIPI
ncbi:hypothetical protein AAZX31_18G079200 [Glycine max]